MADNNTTPAQSQSIAVQPATNPLLDYHNIGEAAGLIVAFGTVTALINKWFDGKAKSREEKHQIEHSRIEDRMSVFKHDLRDAEQKINALEHFRAGDVERIVKVESDLKAISEGQNRIEHALDTMRDESKQGRAELVEAIRRLQDVSFKKV